MQTITQDLQRQLNAIPEPQKIPRLINALAASNLERAHERVYRLIFGSQIRGLRQLATVGRVTKEQARQFYDENTRTPEAQKFYANYGFDGWLKFLISQQVIAETLESVFEITNYGRDFLAYLDRMKMPDAKPW